METYLVKIKRRFGFKTYKVTGHFVRASVKAFNSDLESMDLPITPWLVLVLEDNSMVIIPNIEQKEHHIIGKKINAQDIEKIAEKEAENGVQTTEV
jgi:hypothetical protein